MLNRYFAKTLFKGLAMQGAILRASAAAAAQQKPGLLWTAQRTFFDYSNKDKDIFSSDSEEEHANPKGQRRNSRGDNRGDRRGDSRGDQRGEFRRRDSIDRETEYGDDRYNDVGDVHPGKYEVSEIPLYISKMRNEIREKQKDPKYKGRYFAKIKNLISMHHQNKEKIFAEYPRFANVFYDYCAYRGLYSESSLLATLEDHIVKENIQGMPLAGIRNFLQAMAMLGRGRRDVVGRVKDHLQEREAFKDLRSNLSIASALSNILMLST